MNIYILELENQCWYVGSTSREVEIRFKEHLIGVGSEWTKIHKPLRVFEQFFSTNPFAEDQTTKYCMIRHKISNVRGGSYSQVYMSPEKEELIRNEISSALNLCFRCLKPNHQISDCKETEDANKNIITKPLPKKKRKKSCCSRCGRNSHNKRKCVAKLHYLTGNPL